ncbi:MAG: NAD(P)-dependent alcohol dehydrogenase [Chloroflexota bacterium]|nr:NAD(P)-dependent alcohol dehydrogenase [Anaerolineales bacterium]
MKAVVGTKYGPPEVLRLVEVENPIPTDDQVLVKVHASSVNFNTLGFVRGEPFLVRLWSGLFKPKLRPGNDIAGRVEAVGKNVKEFRQGDEVFGDLSECGFGAFAEYVAVPEGVLVFKPANLSFEEAAAVPEAALVALLGLRDKGQIQKGQKVLIYGASGGIGTFAVQIAKSFGAEVTGVCSTRNLDMVRSIGADHVIDYTKEDFAKGGQQYDLILATAGYRSIFDYRRALKHGGRYVATGGAMKQIFQAMLLGPLLSLTGGKKLTNLYMTPSRKDLLLMKELIESGKVKPVIDRCYPLQQAAEALKYYEKGHARGKVIITMRHANKS